jgi:hypothetical protein
VASGEKLLLNQNSESRIRAPPRFSCRAARFDLAELCEGLLQLLSFMNSLRFSQALVPGLIAGVLSIFTSWLWMGAIFHRFQKLTPQTWRPETGRSHALASAIHVLAAMGIALLFTIVASDQSSSFFVGMGGSLRFGLACWGVFALPIILGDAIYINLHPLIVLGRLLDWLCTSLLATVLTAWWRNR